MPLDDKRMMELQYYQTYYFANIVNNVIDDPGPFLVNLDGLWGDDKWLNFIEPFQKYSAFHLFLEYIIVELLCDQTSKVDLEKRKEELNKFGFVPFQKYTKKLKSLPIENALKEHGFNCQSFEDWLEEKVKTFEDADEDDVYEYYGELSITEGFDKLVSQMVEEVFFLMLLNRETLRKFNDFLSSIILNRSIDDIPSQYKKNFSDDGTLKRVRPPKWAQRAIFFRDRGRCTLCNCDLSGILSLQNQGQYDHIVPIAGNGLNDISNLQLLCSSCNNKKSADPSKTSTNYEKWY